MRPGAVADRERIGSLDALRGVAMLGILLMNVQAFSMPEAAYSNPTVWGSLAGANGAVWLACHLVADRKFMAIFAMLFGAGILLFTGRVEARGGSPGRMHARRMGWLLAFGLLHAYLLWYGDILVTYALCGLLVYPTRRWAPGRRLALGLAVIAFGAALNWVDGRTFPSWPAARRAQVVEETWSPTPADLADEVAAYRGGWIDQMADRVPVAFALETDYFVRSELWRVAGLILIGMSLFQWGVFSARRPARFYALGFVIGAAVGLPVTLWGVALHRAHHWQPAWSMFDGGQFKDGASLPLAFAWTCAVLWTWQRPAGRRLLGPLTAVGRMAFSNYLLETVLCTAVFYGHGLGLFGRVDRVGQLGVVLVLWLLLPLWSSAWLRAFRYGPLEWLWRTLTYGRAPALRRLDAAVPAAPTLEA